MAISSLAHQDRRAAVLRLPRTLTDRWTALPPQTRRVIVDVGVRTVITAWAVWLLIRYGPHAVTHIWAVLRTGSSDEIIRLGIAVLICYIVGGYAMHLLRAVTVTSIPGQAPPSIGTAIAMTSDGRERLATRRQQTAAHEAAHATVALALGAIDVRTTTIPQGGDVGGLTTSTWQRPTGTDAVSQQAWRALVLTLAGHVHDVDSGVLDGGSRRDLDQVSQLALTILSARGPVPCGCPMCGGLYRGEMTFDGLLLHAGDQARHLLAAHTAGHAAIAAALIPPTALTDAALRELAGFAGTPRGEASSSC